MSRWIVACLVVAGSGCGVSSNSVTCSNGLTCPEGTACDIAHKGCVTQDQLASCDGKPDNTPCLTNGACHDEVCFPIACGNGFQDPQEACDDGNNADGDMCAHDCLSDLTCGNSTLDLSTGETCDDGNHVNHDGCTSTCRVENAHWLQYQAKAGPHARVAAAYDSRRDRVVMFSGATDLVSSLSSQTLEWDGTSWSPRPSPSNPPPRYESAMTYDYARGRCVLFGGDASSLQPIEMDDTWEWDGTSWYQVAIAGPPARIYHSLVYDAARKRTVLFGGLSSGTPMSDTWEYDGKTWTEIHPATSPPPRYNAVAGYDPRRGRVVVASGFTGTSNNMFADTWEYDGTTWKNVTPVSGLKPQLVESSLAFDSTLQKLVMFGGYTPSGAAKVTYTWDGTTWTDLGISVTQPDARYAFAFVPAFPHPFLAGGISGSTYDDDVYYFTGSTWTAPPTAPAVGYNMVTNPLRRTYVLYGNGTTYEASATGFTQLTQSPTPPDRGYPGFVADPLHDNVLLFGGGMGSGGTGTNETWILANGVWAKRTPSMLPSGRQGPSMAFDGTRVIMYGGRASDVGAFSADTWSWDNTNWTMIPTASAPPARFLASMGYDPIRKEVILFGGFTYNGDYVYWDDTWAFDGTTWTQRTPMVSPSGRAAATMSWDPARGHLVLVGGSSVLDAWEWTGTNWLTIGVPTLPTGGPGQMSPTLDGSGLTGFGVLNSALARYELRWDGPSADEHCDSTNADLDLQTDCADSDCWSICTPLCPPATTCAMSGPSCGDHTCSAPRETCHTCAVDCMCTAVCGDSYCDAGEMCPGDCPM